MKLIKTSYNEQSHYTTIDENGDKVTLIDTGCGFIFLLKKEGELMELNSSVAKTPEIDFLLDALLKDAKAVESHQQERVIQSRKKEHINNGDINLSFLSVVDNDVKTDILNNIAVSYNLTREQVLDEVVDHGAEHLLDYVTGPLQSGVSVLMKMHRLGTPANAT